MWLNVSRRVLAPVTVVIVSASLMGATTPTPDGVRLPSQRPAVPAMPAVPHATVPLKGTAAGHNPAPGAAKATTWPAAGDADVALPTTAARTATASGSRVGYLPILVGAVTGSAAATTTTPTPPVSVHVHLADQGTARKAGVTGVLFAVQPSTVGTGGMSVGVDYSAFRDAVGANWGNRLHLVSLPACALTTPSVRACQQQTPVPSSANNASTDVVSATVPQASSGVVLAAVAGAAGSNGTFAASSLKPSGTWSVSGASGDFTWQYPIAVPPASAGALAPGVALSYDAQAADGETAGTNNQVTWIGEGWDYNPGYVERTYRPCSDDPTLPAAQQTQDQCWAGQVVTMSLGGTSSALVLDDTTHTWHAASDSGDRIENLAGAGNGALNGEYWKITGTDGTQYFFGRNTGPGHTNQPATNSTWTEPVYGPHPGDPCNSTAGFASSSCQQAWRWNLDYVEDPHGNVTMYYYTPETNYYGANNATTGVQYTRGGYLSRVDYGLRDENGTVYANPAPDQVSFTVAERCFPSGSITCDPSQFTSANAASWPDTPQDQQCLSGAVCNNHGPSFWSTKRLTTITTQYYNGSGYTKVDSYALGQQSSTLGDPALWLNTITRTGYAADGTSITLPPVSFTGQMLDNRVAGYNNEPSMARFRMTDITAETGEIIQITYSDPQCTATHVPAAPSQDTMRCFPVNWTLPFQTNQTLDYFHKYVTTKVAVQDPGALSPTQVTTYTYVGNPAWHYDDNELVKPANRTYGQFRGYPEVDVRTGDTTNSYAATPDKLTLTRTTYFLGMNGDTLPGGGARTAAVSDSLGETLPDNNLYADTPREVQVFNGDGGPRVSSRINDPVIVATTASRARAGLPALTANMTATAKVRSLTDLAAGTVRTTTATYGYDSIGRQIQETDSGDNVQTLCTTTAYADNTTTWVRNKVAETIVSQQVCPAPGTTQAPILSDDRTYYDNSTWGAVTLGDVTRGDVATTNTNGSLTWATTDTASYDTSGRPLTTTDWRNFTTSIAYTPSDGGNLTSTVTTNALRQKSSITIDPGRDVTTSTVDVAGHRTDATYDQLGRLTAEWLPNHTKSAGAQPSTTYSYLLRNNGPQAVTTKSLVDTGSGTDYVTSISLYDAFGQLLQTQTDAEGGGRVVSDTSYDSHGWARHSNNRYFTDGAPATSLIAVADSAVDDRTVTAYDGVGRAVLSTNFKGITETDHTQTVYGGDRTTVIPPQGGVTTTALTDSRGEKIEARQYTAPPTVTGSVVSGGQFVSTTYQYTPQGQQSKITDAAGNVWTYGYDLLGRETTATDPDTGTSTYQYDLSNNLAGSTDGRGQTLAYKYDALNRKIGEYTGSLTGTQLASWVYDTVQTGKLSFSTRFTPQGNYLVGVGHYDGAGNPSNYAVQVPSSVTGLSGTYTTSYGYTTTNQPSSIQPADGGGLPGENIAIGYDNLGNQTGSHGYNIYLGGATYTPFGEAQQYTLGTQGSTAWLTYTRDAQTRRLTEATLSAQIPTPQLNDTTYAYDPAGNLTRTTDVQGPAGSPTQTTCNGYDALDRLNATWTATDNCANPPGTTNIGGTVPYWESWSFDPTGLRASQVQHALPGGDVTTTYTYPAPGAAQPHTLSSTSTTGPTGTASTGYGYDAAGNTTTRTLPTGNQTLTWDAENHLATDTTTAGTSSYVYDADGNELLVTDPGSSTLYLPGEELTYNATAKQVTGTRYYTVNGQTVAVRVGGADPTYLDGDPHGTMQTDYNPDNQTTTRRVFDPYGNQVGQTTAGSAPGTWPDQHGFLNDPVDTSTSLTHIGARQYDSATGRFISVDPQLNPADPQSMTGYTYADNNPITNTDPSGRYALTGVPDWGIPDTTPTDQAIHQQLTQQYGANMRAAGAQQQARDRKTSAALAKKGISQADVAKAENVKSRSIVDVVVKAGGDFLKGLLGITDMQNCFGHGDVGSCVGLLLNVLPIGKIFEEGVNLARFVIRAIDAVRDFFRAAKEADRVLKDVAETTQAVEESFNAASEVNSVSTSTAAADVRTTDSGGGGGPPPPESGGGGASSSNFGPGQDQIHYRKHVLGVNANGSAKAGGADMPEYLDKNDYVQSARELVDGPAGSSVLEGTRGTDTVRFDRGTGALGIKTANGRIRTFFRPDGGESYFRNIPGLKPVNF
jgi:RHS repeat-associated protein